MDATEGLSPNFDPGMLTFSQAQGYEDLPGPLKLEELQEKRGRISGMCSICTIKGNPGGDLGQQGSEVGASLGQPISVWKHHLD